MFQQWSENEVQWSEKWLYECCKCSKFLNSQKCSTLPNIVPSHCGWKAHGSSRRFLVREAADTEVWLNIHSRQVYFNRNWFLTEDYLEQWDHYIRTDCCWPSCAARLAVISSEMLYLWFDHVKYNLHMLLITDHNSGQLGGGGVRGFFDCGAIQRMTLVDVPWLISNLGVCGSACTCCLGDLMADSRRRASSGFSHRLWQKSSSRWRALCWWEARMGCGSLLGWMRSLPSCCRPSVPWWGGTIQQWSLSDTQNKCSHISLLVFVHTRAQSAYSSYMCSHNKDFKSDDEDDRIICFFRFFKTWL